VKIALDATYSLDENPSGVAVYSRELLDGLARSYPEVEFLWCFRPHRIRRCWRAKLPRNCRRRLLGERFGPRHAALFHGLNQRLPHMSFPHSVSTFHDLFVLTGEYSTPEFRRRFAEQARHAAADSEAIIAVSHFTARQVEELLGVERARIHVVHHGVRIGPAVPAAGEQAAGERIILHVGALQRRKNLSRLVAAFEQLRPPWRLVLAGSSGFGSAEILQRIQASPARDRIEVTGYLPAEALHDWYARAAVFAFPSLDEGFGLPVLEAMAAGVPVLTSNRSALPEVAGDAAVLVDPEDIDALTASLRRLTRDEDLRRELIRRGFDRAHTFSWTTAARQTWEVYEKLLSGFRRPQQS
jgi:glycosyltransferase involved in cell wall biosynthesis